MVHDLGHISNGIDASAIDNSSIITHTIPSNASQQQNYQWFQADDAEKNYSQSGNSDCYIAEIELLTKQNWLYL